MAPEGLFDGRGAAVTGAGGFIGRAIAARLAAEGAAVVGLDAAPGSAGAIRAAGARPVIADVADRRAVAAALDGAELVVHAAALVHEWGRMDDFVRVNVRGTANVLSAAMDAGVERVVHLSSVVVYGYDDPTEQSEDAHRRVYGIPYIDTKSASDRLAAATGAAIVRPGDVYGPGSRQWVTRPIALARSRRLAIPRADGLMLPVYVDDLVEAVVLALQAGAPGRAYTAWDGDAVSVADYFGALTRIAGASPPVRLPAALLRLAGGVTDAAARVTGREPAFTARAVTFISRRGTAPTERIRAELGWAPRVTLAEGLRRTEAWLRAEGLL